MNERRMRAGALATDAIKRLPTVEKPDERISAEEGDTITLLDMEAFEQLLKVNGCRHIPFDFSQPGAYGRAVLTWRTLLSVRVHDTGKVVHLDGREELV